MSERSFFDWRNSLPGFTFILFVLGMNFAPLLFVFTTQSIQATFGAILAFFTLVSGSAIGFLLSQVWWQHYRNHGAHYYFGKNPRKQIERLVKKYGLLPARNTGDINRIQKVLAVYSYILFSQQQKDPELVNYLIRRGDTFHSFSATRISLLLGLGFGFLFRILSQVFIFRWTFEIGVSDLCPLTYSAFSEILILALVISSALILFELFGNSRAWMLTQYDDMADALITQSGIRRWKLQEIFLKVNAKDEGYFDPQWKPEDFVKWT